MINLRKYGTNHPMTFELNNYCENNNLYVGLVTHEEGWPEPWSSLTVNLSVKCADDCAFIDTNNNGEEIIDWLVENKLGKPTGRIKVSGWCVYPEFKFNVETLMEHVTNDDRQCYEDEFDDEEEYIPSSTYRDYGPSNPWDAPGMSVKDFL